MKPETPARPRSVFAAVVSWFDSSAFEVDPDDPRALHIDWLRVTPFLLLHAACLLVFWVGWSWTAVGVAATLHFGRVFALTGFYHRYFSHKSFKTSRAAQFLFAVAGAASAQRGPLWWAAHHRFHHAHADDAEDAHSPRQHGLLWSHMGWFMARIHYPTRLNLVPDLARYPELRFLDRFDMLVPLALISGLFGTGVLLEAVAPQLGTSGLQLAVWGFCISTVTVFHVTGLVNSLAHTLGGRRYETGDDSRNNLAIALLTFGEGWHNNHHRYPGAARQGFFWWEIDITYYLLRLLSALGVIWDLRGVPERVRRGLAAGDRAPADA